MNKEDLAFWKFGFDVLQTAMTLGIGIYVWVLSKHKVNATKIAKLEDAQAEETNNIKNRLTAIETTIEHMPDKRSIHNLHERLNGQSELLRKMEGEMKGVTDNTALILQALIKKGEDK